MVASARCKSAAVVEVPWQKSRNEQRSGFGASTTPQIVATGRGIPQIVRYNWAFSLQRMKNLIVPDRPGVSTTVIDHSSKSQQGEGAVRHKPPHKTNKGILFDKQNTLTLCSCLVSSCIPCIAAHD